MMKTIFKRDLSKIASTNVELLEKKMLAFFAERDVHEIPAKKLISNCITRMGVVESADVKEINRIFVQSMHGEIANLLQNGTKLDLLHNIENSNYPFVLVIYGINGSGKTTLCGKLINKIINSHKTSITSDEILISSFDHQREFGQEQLEAICHKLKARFVATNKTEAVSKSIQNIRKTATESNCKLIIIDTPGWSVNNPKHNSNISAIHSKLRPNHSIFLVDGMMGQCCYPILQEVVNYVNINSFVISKLRDFFRNGTIINATFSLDRPVSFVSEMESLDDLQTVDGNEYLDKFFDATKIINSLNKKNLEGSSKSKNGNVAEVRNLLWLEEKLRKANNVKSVAKMVQHIEDPKEARNKFFNILAKLEVQIAILNSMTVQEKINPDILNKSRIERIAKGSGTSMEDVVVLCDKILSIYQNS